MCHRCGIVKYKECYTPAQWDKPQKRGNCKACVKLREEENTPLDCSKCWEWKGETAFAPTQRCARSNKTRVCLDCVETRMCIACKLHRPRNDFSQGEWEHAAYKNERGKCKDCVIRSEKEMWQCKACSKTFHKSFYTRWCIKHGEKKSNLVRCNSCVYNDEQEHKREQAKTFAMVMKQDITNSTGTTTPDQRAATSEEQHSTTMTPVNKSL